jgi:DNA-binding SARP family transcriptional activator
MRVEVLGPLRVLVRGGELTPRSFRGSKPKQILEILVAERGRSVSKERLADLLWGDEVPRSYVATLEAYVSVLRQVLDPGGRPRESVVLTERGAYRLELDRVELDVDDFDRLVREAGQAAPTAALDRLQAALLLVRGQAFEDEPYAEWAQAMRDVYLQRRVQALIDAGRLSLLTGDASCALAMAEQAVALSPLAEPAYQVLMTAAYSLWRQDEALAAFDRCRRLLAEELGADPLDETVALYMSILRHEDLADLLPRQDRGARSAVGTVGRLSLLGREQELQQLHAAADRALSERLTIALVTGVTGVGKTRLVQTLVEQLSLPVASNRCSDLESTFPYLALSLALQAGPPSLAEVGRRELDDLLDRAGRGLPIDEFARLRVMEGVAKAIREEEAFVLVLDDVHWADPETLTTLGFLQRRCSMAKVLVVVTCDPVIATSHHLRALRPDFRVDLRELSPADVEALAGPDAYAAAGGNPWHVTSWLEARARGLQETFTPELRERVITACWDLGPQPYRLLCAAATVERPTFDPALLSHLLGASAADVGEQLEQLFDKRVLDVVGQDFRFRSPAVRSVLLDTLSPARRSQLQRTAEAFLNGEPGRYVGDGEPVDEAPCRFLRRSAGDGQGARAEPPSLIRLARPQVIDVRDADIVTPR